MNTSEQLATKSARPAAQPKPSTGRRNLMRGLLDLRSRLAFGRWMSLYDIAGLGPRHEMRVRLGDSNR